MRMMTKRARNISLLLLVFLLLTTCIFGFTFTRKTKAEDLLSSDRFAYSGVKYKVAQVAPQNNYFTDSRKGLVLYAYDSGAKADLKGTFTGTFETEVKASTAGKTKADLVAYSFVFTNLINGETFALTVEDGGEETSAYVNVNGDKAGIYYNVDTSWDCQPHGYTTSQNNNGTYTRTLTKGTTKLRFEPTDMVVSVMNSAGEYITVWDLTEEVMDGKRYGHLLEPMELYSVSVEFTSVSAGGKGELTIYSINGEDYGSVVLPETAPMIYTEVQESAVVNVAYALPCPEVYSTETLEAEDVSYVLYDGTGKALSSGKYNEGLDFTPTESGTYYLYYSVESEKGAVGEAYLKIKAYGKENVSVTFSEVELGSETVGLNTTLEIPERTVESNLFAKGYAPNARVAVKKDGQLIEGYESVEAGFHYVFDALGEYEIAYLATVGGEEYTADAIVITVSNDVAGVVMEKVEESYAYNETLSVPEATVYIGGEVCNATHTLFDPLGEEISDSEVLLDEIGSYTLYYAYEVGGRSGEFEYTFDVEKSVTDLFAVSGKGSVAYDDTSGNADMEGVLFMMTGNDAALTYDLDLRNKTKDDLLVELFAVSSTPGVHDLNGFYVTLTDKLDPTNYLTIRCIEGTGNMVDGTFVRCRASNQTSYSAWYINHSWDDSDGNGYWDWKTWVENAMNHDAGGYTLTHDFGMNKKGTDLDRTTIKLYWDSEEKALYTDHIYNDRLYPDPTHDFRLIADFDDPNMYTNLWGGFTDDSQVELKITPITVTGSAALKILAVDGYYFNEADVKDTAGPSVAVDMEGMSEVPVAKTGSAYKIFDLILSDDFCAEEALKTQVSVTYGNTEIPVENGAFIPQYDGYYTIRYSVSDAYGNTTETSVEVESRSDVAPIEVSLTESWLEALNYGYAVEFPAYAATGGTGRYVYTQEVTCDGEAVELGNDGFTPLKAGEYVVTLTATDYIGQSSSISKTYHVEFSSDIIFEESSVILPPAFLNGNPYVFDTYIGGYYATEGAALTETVATVKITDANGETTLPSDGKYTPKASESHSEATVEILFEGYVNGAKIEKKITRTVPIYTAQQSTSFITDYFVTENATVATKNQFITFTAIEENKELSASFIRAVAADEFEIQFKPNSTKDENGESVFHSNFETLEITLTDKYDPTIKIVIQIVKNGDELLLYANGKGPMIVAGSLTAATTENIVVSYNNGTFALKGANGTSIGTVTTGLDGKKFGGFPSQEVYVSFRLLGVGEDCAINLVSINNQKLLSTRVDTAQPQIYIDGSYSGMYTAGTAITLPVARAYDVLNYTTPATLTVTAPDGSYLRSVDGVELNGVSADREYVIEPTAFGKYAVSYYSEDLSGQKRESTRYIVVYDDVLPELTLDKALPERVWTGTTVTVPSYTVTDNGDVSKVKVYICYTEPGGMMCSLKDGKIVADKAGRYTVYFYLIDENECYNTVTFEFTAVERN